MIHKTLPYEQSNDTQYTLVKLDILTDKDLSFGAKGIFCYLLSKFDNWKTRTKDLTNHSTNGSFSVRSLLSELKRTGTDTLIATYRKERKQQYNNSPYVKIDNNLLNNPKLSWQAKGLLIYLLSKPVDWKVERQSKHKQN